MTGETTGDRLDGLLAHRGWKRIGRDTFQGPGPNHGPGDCSQTVRRSATAPDGFVVHSFAGDDAMAGRDHVRALVGSPPWEPARRGDDPSPSRPRPAPITPAPVKGDVEEDEARRIAYAMRRWKEAGDPRRTPAERYVTGRGLAFPPGDVDEVIRFHGSLGQLKRGPGGPAMLCLVRHALTNEPRGIHRTFLDHGGRLLHRAALGPIRRGAIKLTPDEEVTNGLFVAEGVETALAALARGLAPVWSLLSTAGLDTFPVLPHVESLMILADHDANGAGARSALGLAARWRKAGREARIVMPRREGDDFADLAPGRAA